MRYFKVARFLKIQEVSEKDAKDVPSDWVEVQKNGEPLEKKKVESKK